MAPCHVPNRVSGSIERNRVRWPVPSGHGQSRSWRTACTARARHVSRVGRGNVASRGTARATFRSTISDVGIAKSSPVTLQKYPRILRRSHKGSSPVTGGCRHPLGIRGQAVCLCHPDPAQRAGEGSPTRRRTRRFLASLGMTLLLSSVRAFPWQNSSLPYAQTQTRSSPWSLAPARYGIAWLLAIVETVAGFLGSLGGRCGVAQAGEILWSAAA